jgi:hypothetical protein
MEKRTTATIDAMATTIFLNPRSTNFSEAGLVLSENFDVLALFTRKSNLHYESISNFKFFTKRGLMIGFKC